MSSGSECVSYVTIVTPERPLVAWVSRVPTCLGKQYGVGRSGFVELEIFGYTVYSVAKVPTRSVILSSYPVGIFVTATACYANDFSGREVSKNLKYVGEQIFHKWTPISVPLWQ